MDQLGKVGKTDKGFELINFIDLDGNKCSLQQSSLAVFLEPGQSAIRLGRGKDRIHLDLEQVDALIMHLRAWREGGSFAV